MINRHIKNKIRSGIYLFLSYFFILGQTFALAQSATLLPNGLQQFFDNNGNPLSSGSVYFYIPNTTTFKTTWKDAGETIPNTNPVILDAAGRAQIYGSGGYRQILKDVNNNLIWDQVTYSYQPTGAPIAQTGDGDLVGTIKPWAGMIAPNQYAFAYGQELSRVTYVALFTAITQSATAVNCTNGSPIISGLTDTSNIPNGAIIESTCAPVGANVISKTSSSITLSANAILTGNDNIIIFPYGNGNGSSTFNVPDLRGNTLVGRCNMGGTNCTNTTATYFGSNPQATGAKGGNQNYTLLTDNLPAYTPTGTLGNTTATGTIAGTVSITDPGHTHTISTGTSSAAAAGGIVPLTPSGGTPAVFTSSVATTGISAGFSGTFTGAAHTHTFTGTAQGGTSTPFATIQPSLTINYIIKITPDQNSAIATGVTSLGLMTGDIACGANISCTGNIISVTGAVAGGSNTQIQYNNSGVLAGNANLTFTSGSARLGVGSNGGLTGSVGLSGATTGGIVITVLDNVGSPVATFGSNSGTPVVTATGPLSINSSTGNLSITGVTSSTGSGPNLVLGAGPTISGAALTGGPNISQNWLVTGVITPTALSGAVNDYNPTGLATANIIRQDGGAADRNVTGLLAQTAGTKITLINVGTTNSLILKSSSGSSSATNQFLIGADVTISPSESVKLWYDGISSKWRIESAYTNAGGTPTGTVTSITAGVGLSGGTITTSGTVAVQAPTITVLTTGTNQTYNVPANTSSLEIWVQGGGAGGGGGGSGGGAGGNGNQSCFGLNATACTTPIIQATGGTGTSQGAANLGAPGTCSTGGNISADTGNSGIAGLQATSTSNGNGGNGGSSPYFGGNGYANPNATSVIAAINSGSGGGGGTSTSLGSNAGHGGPSGGGCHHIITSPAASYIYTIGTGGTGGATGSGSFSPTSGAAGKIIIIAR